MLAAGFQLPGNEGALWKGHQLRTNAYNFPVHWRGLGRKDIGSLLEFMNGRKIWVEDVPKVLIAREVLGSRHSLHTGLLGKGFMGPISSVYAPRDQVWFTEAPLPCSDLWRKKKSPTSLWVNITEKSRWTPQKAHVFLIYCCKCICEGSIHWDCTGTWSQHFSLAAGKEICWSIWGKPAFLSLET